MLLDVFIEENIVLTRYSSNLGINPKCHKSSQGKVQVKIVIVVLEILSSIPVNDKEIFWMLSRGKAMMFVQREKNKFCTI